MSTHNITVAGGKSVRLLTAGKYCDRDIIVTAEGGSEDLNAVLTEQEALIATLQETLRGKAAGEGGGIVTPTQEKTVDITENGIHEVVPDDGYALSKVTANVNVPIPDGYIVPSGTKEVTENGTHDVTEYASVKVDVPIPDGYVKPSGTLEVTENGEHDVTEYTSVNVNVPTVGEGSVEVWTGTVYGNTGLGYAPDVTVAYIDETFSLRRLVVSAGEEVTITVPAHTLMCVNTYGEIQVPENWYGNNIENISSNSDVVLPTADGFTING